MSKRINSLQISGEFTFAQIPIVHNDPVSQVTIGINNNHLHLQSQPQHQQQQQQSNQEPPPTYNPELSQDENPHYYNQNKSLYELYMLRQLRSVKEPYV